MAGGGLDRRRARSRAAGRRLRLRRLSRGGGAKEYERGLELQELGNLPDALAAFGSAIQLDPYMPDLYTARGYVYYLYGATSSALADLNRSLEINPDSSQAYYYRDWCWRLRTTRTTPF